MSRLAASPAGVHYTPPALVGRVLDETLDVWLAERGERGQAELRLIDPSCGEGAFLVAAYRRLLGVYATREGTLSPARRADILARHVFGLDVDARAVARCRTALRDLADAPCPALEHNVAVGDALVAPAAPHARISTASRASHSATPTSVATAARATHAIDGALEPFDFDGHFGAQGFDVVVGNPPYVDSETMTRERPALRRHCAAHYASARGNWDLFCPFIERALALLRPGGLHGFVVPNRLASAEYARTCRALLVDGHSLRWLADYADANAFAAATYPIAYAVAQGRSGSGHVRYERIGSDGQVARASTLAPGAFRREAGWTIGDQERTPELEAMLERWPALGAQASVLGAATVAEAYALEALLSDDANAARADLKVLNSGTIDPHRALWGSRPMRYLGQRYGHPVVRAQVQAQLPARRLQQARTPKVIIAGMTRAIEAVADPHGQYLAAKSTTIVVPGDPRDVPYLTAVLNTQLMSAIARALYPGLVMAGGYLRLGPPQLRRMPLRPTDWNDPQQAQRARELVRLAARGPSGALEAAVRRHHGLRPG